MRPALCIVSGDLVYGVKPNVEDATKELERQYAQAEAFLVGLADRFFGGNRGRIVILPGNHDVSYDDVMVSTQKIEVPTNPEKKAKLVAELFTPRSRLRWSWRELCFFKITDDERYCNRLRHFATTYESFYQGRHTFPLVPEQQYGVFDFPDLGFCVVALNSCYNNDPLRRAGAFHPTALTEACRALRETDRAGWLTAAAWHHNLVGGPAQDDYLDVEFLQLLIDAGVSLGFHGHQHLSECFEERYRLGPSPRKMTIISASTLCAEPRNLRPGVPQVGSIEAEVPGVVGSPVARPAEEGIEFAPSPPIIRDEVSSDMKILTTGEQYPQLNNFTMLLGLSDRLMRTEADFFRTPPYHANPLGRSPCHLHLHRGDREAQPLL